MSTRLFLTIPRSSHTICRATHPSSSAIGDSSARHFASSSKDTLDDPQPFSNAHEPSLIVFDAPSKPSEHLTRRTARSPFSLNDYYNARQRLSAPTTHQVRSSTSATRSTSTPSTSSDISSLNSFSHTHNVNARTFDNPSRPREYYTRPQRKQDLPQIKSPLYIATLLAALGLSAWGAFILYATNMERVSSSVVRQLSSNIKSIPAVKEALGEDVHLERKWWLGGEPWIDGAVNLLQGNVDVSFRVEGSKGGGTVYFTSVREAKGQPFTILRHKIICDNGEILRLG